MSRRILLIGHNPDYLPLAPYHMALHLSRRGHRVTLLLPGNNGLRQPWQPIRINERFDLYLSPTLLGGQIRKGFDPLDVLAKIYRVSKLSFDVVFLFDSRPAVSLPGVFAKLTKKIPLIIYWTDWFGRGGIIANRSGKFYRVLFEGIETFFEEYFRRFADSYCVVCSALETRLRGLGYSKQVAYFPVGCNSPPVRGYSVDGLRQQLGLPRTGPLIGCVGSLFPADAKLLFESIPLLRKAIDAKLVLIGNNIHRARYGVPEHAIETGKVVKEDLYNYIGACDIMLMPLMRTVANNGRWPSKLNDYVSMGKPIVSTDISVVRELFQVAKFGEIADDEPVDFGEKILKLLVNEELISLYSANAYALASGLLSWDSIVDKLESLMGETLGRSNYGKIGMNGRETSTSV